MPCEPVAFQRSGGSTKRDVPSPLLPPFLALYHDMNRLLADMPGAGAGTAGAPNQLGSKILVPDITIAEAERAVRITAEVPGASDSGVEVMLDDDTLIIRAVKEIEHAEDRQRFHVRERVFGTFQRALALPFRVDPAQVQARVANGVITIAHPKSGAQPRTHRVQVRGAVADHAPAGSPSQSGGASDQQDKAPDRTTPH